MAIDFKGSAEHTLDAKGRLIVPAKYREPLLEGVVVTRGMEHCLEIYPKAEFDKASARLRRLPRENRKARAYVRTFLSGAEDEVPDSQHRIKIPAALREYAGLTREVTIVGQLERLEIWDRERWADYLEAEQGSFADIDTPFDFDLDNF